MDPGAEEARLGARGQRGAVATVPGPVGHSEGSEEALWPLP